MSETGRKLLRGASVRVLANVVQMVVALCLTPYVLEALGAHHYGFWVLAATLLGFYGVLDLGVSSGVARFTARALASGDEAALRRYLATSVACLTALGMAVLLVTLLVAALASRAAPSAADAHVVFWLILMLGGALGGLFPVRAFHGLLIAHLRYDWISAVSLAVSLVRLPASVLVLRAGGGLLGLAAASALLQAAEAVAIAGLSRHVHGRIGLTRRDLDLATARELLAYGWPTLVAQVADLLRFKLSPVLIATFKTATLVAQFDLADKLNRIAGETARALLAVLEPVFSRQDGAGDTARLRRSYLFTCKIAAYVAALLGGLVAVFGGAFLVRWVGPEYAFLTPVMQILVVGTVFAAAQMPTVGFLFGTARHASYARSNVVHGVLVLALTALLVGPFGLVGVALGSTLPTIAIKFFVQPVAACRLLGLPLREFWGQTLRSLLVPAPYLLAVALLVRPLLVPEYFRIGFLAGASAALYVPYILLVGFTGEERQRLSSAVLPARRPPLPPLPPGGADRAPSKPQVVATADGPGPLKAADR